jgi:hypothetical protein
VGSVPRLCNEDQLLLQESPETAAGGSCERNIHCWKMLPSSAETTATENTSIFVIVICKM